MRLNNRGATRTVLLIGGVAIKIPGAWGKSRLWVSILNGLLANCQEAEFSRSWMAERGLCPVLFSLPGGFILVMKRAAPMTEDQWADFDFDAFVYRKDCTLPVEQKRDSFGWVDGKVVAVDFGS
jgi:hypothetical protein